MWKGLLKKLWTSLDCSMVSGQSCSLIMVPVILHSELKDYLKTKRVKPIHGRIRHPQTQGKIERYHRSMKSVVKLDHYYCPEELVEALKNFVNYYNNERYHESLDNVTPADVYWGRKDRILKRREKTKILNMKMRRVLYTTEKLNII